MDGAPEFYVLGDTREPPVRLHRYCNDESPSDCLDSPCFSAPLPSPVPSQLLVFSLGYWSGLYSDTKVDVHLESGKGKVIRLGTLASESRCFLWECSPEDKKICMSKNRKLCVRMVIQGQVCVKPNDSNQERRKRKRRVTEEENFCPNKWSGKGHATQQKSKSGKDKAPTTQSPLGSGAESNSCVPTGRWGHAICPVDQQTLILIGGQGTRMQFCKDSLWKFYTENNTWSPVETLADGSTPEARTGHTAVFDPDRQRIYVFGGFKNRKWFNDVHILDTVTWRWRSVEAKGKVPPLSYHTCSLFRGELFVLGGVFPRPNPEPDGCSDTLYIFDPEHEIWYQPIVLGNKPAARSGHSTCLMNKELYIFGGWDTPVCYNDLHLLDLSLMEFSPVEVNGSVPSPRCWHSVAPLSSSCFIIHGGYDGNQALSDTYLFSTVTKTWTSLVHDSLPCSPRAGFSMLPLPGIKEENKDWITQELLIFGGGNNEGEFYSDTVRVRVSEIVKQ